MIGLGIAGLVAAILGGIASYSSNKAAQKAAQVNTDATNAANMKMAEYAHSKDLETQNAANIYNSPESQMARLNKAGLNPNLVYGSGTVAGNIQGTLPKYNAPTMDYNYLPKDALASAVGSGIPDMISRFQDFQMRQAQVDNVKAQTNATNLNSVNAALQAPLLQQKWWQGKANLQGMPYRNAMLEESMNQMRALTPYSQSINASRARAGELNLQLMNQALGKGNEDLVMKRFQNEWMKSGVSGRDNIFLRMLVRQFPDLFGSLFGTGK